MLTNWRNGVYISTYPRSDHSIHCLESIIPDNYGISTSIHLNQTFYQSWDTIPQTCLSSICLQIPFVLFSRPYRHDCVFASFRRIDEPTRAETEKNQRPHRHRQGAQH